MIDRADFLKTLKHCTETGLCDWIDAQISAAVAAEREACAAICEATEARYLTPNAAGTCIHEIRARAVYAAYAALQEQSK